jgi:hypothetical protein
VLACANHGSRGGGTYRLATRGRATAFSLEVECVSIPGVAGVAAAGVRSIAREGVSAGDDPRLASGEREDQHGRAGRRLGARLVRASGDEQGKEQPGGGEVTKKRHCTQITGGTGET